MIDNRAVLANLVRFLDASDDDVEMDLGTTIDTLRSCGDTTLVPELHRLLERFLDEDDDFGRDVIATILAAIAGTAVLPTLLRAATREAHDDQENLYSEIASLLCADEEAGRRTATAYATSEAVAERRTGLRALACLPGAPAVPLLTVALSDADPEVRSLAVAKLCDTWHQTRAIPYRPIAAPGHAEAYAALEQALRNPFEDVRAAAVGFLGDRGDGDAVGELAAHVDDPTPRIRSAIAYALGQLGGAEAITLLRRLAEDPERGVRQRAQAALGALGGADALDPILALADDPAPERRVEAAKALSRAVESDPRAAQRIIALIGDPEATVRAASVSALATVTERARWTPHVLALADDPDPVVRQRVAVVLRHLDPEAAAPVLRRYLDDPDPTLSWIANRQLQK
ncbi:HEAT repeat domain-containing protein [Actinoplanes sp. NPDC051346]|uniref:HEAT repeat domain-containing protein n=1 Tax=Actinoplanes sp. NPDC051346 TaxID=3155048 RepID=UPI003443A733